MIYEVKNSESIVDVVLNSTGDLSAWEEICNLNGFESWTPELQPGQKVETPNIVNQNVLKSLSPISNYSVFDLNDKISALVLTLNSVTILEFKKPEIKSTKLTYIVKEGETITDVVLNSTGSLDNWETILNANNFTEWNPTLEVGQEIIIDYLSLQKNNIYEFNKYPVCNDSGIQDLDNQISILISKFDNNILFDDDLVQVEFDDDLTDAQFN